ncbi:hypothetical protein SEMRO_1763_G296000.1 [Seminavis robusta]|uniref:Uncharacterized protein n=1 Tax=Seminavis robusta TaxID=568900 RepID=A0A9N8EUZ3_9STRA|nr:hypothetical protein SEMRO_1763_G296000.1 [Seminavis robusta]|eukprot:Sro1763_g296000.1 n/a (332) ;mRNA; f:14667-15662
MSTPCDGDSSGLMSSSRSWSPQYCWHKGYVRDASPAPATSLASSSSTIRPDVDDRPEFVVLLNESEPLPLTEFSKLAKDSNSAKCLGTYIKAREGKLVASNNNGNPVCVVSGLREGGEAQVAQDLWESLDRRLSWVVVAEDSLWIVEFAAGMVHDGVAQSINTQPENRIDELGLRIFAFVGASLVEIDHADFDQDMAPDGHVRLARGPGQIIGHARLFVEVGDSQLLGNGSDPKTLLGRTAQWLTCGIAENICVLIVKLYGDVEEDPSSDGMTMALINREGVQWIRSWGDTSKDDTVSVFRQYARTSGWRNTAAQQPQPSRRRMVLIATFR